MDPDKQIKLIQELREGSQQAFTMLYLAYVDRLYGYALKLTTSETEAQDIVQESFTRIWENRTRISPELSFKSYLFHISYHLIIDKFRKRINMIDIDACAEINHSALQENNKPEDLLNYTDMQNRLNELLSGLSSRQQQIYQMSREQGLSAKVIGEQLNISEKTVHNQLTMIGRKLWPLLHTFIYLIFSDSIS